MESYKIRVNNPAESTEAQELFFELGYEKRSVARYYPSWISNFHGCNGRDLKYTSEPADRWLIRCKEITLPQLRDLVVLHRNDVNDATHAGRSGSEYFVDRNDTVFFFDGVEGIEKQVDVNNLKPIHNPVEQGLISSADALRALADGREVLIQYLGNTRWFDVPEDETLDELRSSSNKFRLKPRTITLNIEIPAPFEPKEGESYWILNPYCDEGYCEERHNNGYTSIGVWRTEEDVKQVVEALRGALNNG